MNNSETRRIVENMIQDVGHLGRIQAAMGQDIVNLNAMIQGLAKSIRAHMMNQHRIDIEDNPFLRPGPPLFKSNELLPDGYRQCECGLGVIVRLAEKHCWGCPITQQNAEPERAVSMPNQAGSNGESKLSLIKGNNDG